MSGLQRKKKCLEGPHTKHAKMLGKTNLKLV